MDEFYIGIDLGGTKIEGAVITSTGNVLKSKRIATPTTYQDHKNELLHLIENLRKDFSIKGVGIATPGSIDPKTRLLRNAPNSPAINGTNFYEDLAKNLDLPVKVENDANCLILSEFYFGHAKEYKNALGIIMGTGFGAGVIIDSKLLMSPNGLASEIGHSILDINGRKCLCGNKGCVEAYLSGPSLLKRFLEKYPNKNLKTTEEIFSNHDFETKTFIKEIQYEFSRLIASLISLYDPEIIVLGGGLSNQSLYYKCEEEIKSYVFGSDFCPKIIQAKHGDASGKLGAASLFFL